MVQAKGATGRPQPHEHPPSRSPVGRTERREYRAKKSRHREGDRYCPSRHGLPDLSLRIPCHSIDQIFWLPVLVIIGLLLTRIVFIDGGERRITLARSVVFYLIAAGIVLLRHLVLGNPVVPLFQAIALVGIVSFAALHIRERRRIPKGTD
jgi:hypothetical protein